MTSQANLEKRRGLQDSSRQIAALREQWPAAFPAKPYDIKPLELGVLNRIMAVMGWSKPYTSGVLVPWKASAAYCLAVLCIERRITLEGEPAEPVDDEARTMAQERLAFLKARQDQKRKALAPAAAAPIAPPPASAKAPAVVGESKPARSPHSRIRPAGSALPASRRPTGSALQQPLVRSHADLPRGGTRHGGQRRHHGSPP